MLKIIKKHFTQAKGKIKWFFEPIFDASKKESGLALSSWILIGLAVLAIGGGLYAARGAIAQASIDIMFGIMLGLTTLTFEVAKFFADLSSSLFGEVVRPILTSNDWAITRNLVFISMWNVIKNWANMLIVVALIGVALATILRFREYEAKKLLAPILIVALLVNFSGVFVGLVIDISNVLMSTLLGVAGNNPADTLLHNLKTSEQPLSGMPTNNNDQIFQKILATMAFTLNYTVLAIAFLYFIVIFLQRYVVLAALFILSPLAFVFYVFPVPKARALFSSWWEHLIKWSFIGIGGMFFLNISTRMTGIVAGSEIKLMNMVIVVSFIIIGLKLTMKSAGPLASVVMGLATTALTGGTSLAMGMAAKATKNLGGERALNAMKTAGSYALVKTGLRSEARHEQMKQRIGQPTKEEQDEVNNMSPEELKRYTEGKATTFGMPTVKGQRMKAAAINRSFKEGLMKNLPQVKQIESAQYAIGFDRNLAGGIVGNMSTEAQAQILTDPNLRDRFDVKARDGALKGLTANGQLNKLNQTQLIGAMKESKSIGSDLKDVIKGSSGQDLANMITQHQDNMNVAAGGSGVEILDATTRTKISEALRDKKQLDLIGHIGEAIAQRRQRKIDAVIEATEHGGLPQDFVEKMNSDDQSKILNDPTLLLNRLSPQQQTEVLGKATGSLMKKGELNRIDSTRRENVFETAIQSGIVDVEDLEDKDYHAGANNDRRLIRLGATEADVNEARAGRAEIAAGRTATASQAAAIAALAPHQADARNQVLDENIGTMNGDQLRDIDTTDLIYQRISKLEPGKIRQFQNASPAHRVQIKTRLPQLDADIVTEREEALNATLGWAPGTLPAARVGVAPLPSNPAQANIHTTEASRLQRVRTAIFNLP